MVSFNIFRKLRGRRSVPVYNDAAELRKTPCGSRIRQFICRLDVCTTFVFFVLLMVTAFVTTTVSQTLIIRHLRAQWLLVHQIRIAAAVQGITGGSELVRSLANGFLAVHAHSNLPTDTDETIRYLCASLDRFDRTFAYRTFAYLSLDNSTGAGCVHGLAQMDSMSTLVGYRFIDHLADGTYLVDNQTYQYAQPLQKTSEFPPNNRNATAIMPINYGTQKLFPLVKAYYNGTVSHIDPHLNWMYPARMPHLMFYNLPIGQVARGLPLHPGQSPSDFVQIRIDGSGFLRTNRTLKSAGFSAAAFINQTLTSADPSIFSNTWGQQSVSNNSIYSPSVYFNLTYLNVSNISNPLMRAALQHVNLAMLANPHHTSTVEFLFSGAPAIVTAFTLDTESGLRVPLVMVSQQSVITPGYLRLKNIFNGVNAVVIVLFTALFWWFVHHEYSAPLVRMTELLRGSVATGKRALLTTSRTACVQLRESAALIRVFNNCMRRLRYIEDFVPPEVHALLNHERAIAAPSLEASVTLFARSTNAVSPLQSQYVSVVYISIHRSPPEEVQRTSSWWPAELQQRRGHRLAAAAQSAARNASTDVNSGPFPSPAALAVFVMAVRDLAKEHGGAVHRIAPDSCVVHFGQSTQAHLRSPATVAAERAMAAARQCGIAELEPAEKLNAACVRRDGAQCVVHDAEAALHFALALQQWMDGCDDRIGMPDVHTLVDTGVFSCGQYRGDCCEQTVAVVLGRDVQRDLGSVPAQIGVRVAMTEETAMRVRAKVRVGARKGAMNVGVRQLPVEALRTGRVGLDANVVILYEALPGPVVGNAAWQRYSRCCFDGFELMIRGDYAGALRCYKCVADISDLEPGLLPRSLRREAASSDVTDGAVSVQVARLMRECEVRVAAGITEGYYRARYRPLGIDAVLRRVTPSGVAPEVHHSNVVKENVEAFSLELRNNEVRKGSAGDVSSHALASPRVLVTLSTFDGTVRCVLATPTAAVYDNYDRCWKVQKQCSPTSTTPAVDAWSRSYTALGVSGALCSLRLLPFHSTQPDDLQQRLADVTDGPLPSTLSAKVPTARPTRAQLAACESLFAKHVRLCHPNLTTPLAYSTSVEGSLAVLLPYTAGETIRTVVHRYRLFSSVSVMRFFYELYSGLAYLHDNGVAHGRLSADAVLVGSDGACCLLGHFTDLETARSLFVLPTTYYVSPAMAAGHPPTPACDIFCAGLLGIEVFGQRRPWKWSEKAESQQQRTTEELEDLMRVGGPAFCAAVVDGSVVPALEGTSMTEGVAEDASWENEQMRCLSYVPSERPTAKAMRDVRQRALIARGFFMEKR